MCKTMQDELLEPEKQPLFELSTERLVNWSPAEDVVSEAIGATNCKSIQNWGYLQTNFIYLR